MSDADYAIHLDPLVGAGEWLDVQAVIDAADHPWFNQTLVQVGDVLVRLGVFEPGEYHWHQHDEQDEFFFVLDGHFIIDLEDRSVILQPQEGFVVPKGVVHRTRALERAVILMVETAAIVPTGDA